MRLLSVVLVTAALLPACSRPAPKTPRVHAPLPQVTGALVLPGLRQPVAVVRDRWGIPHITAQNEHDLFFAQGFVQAQDRLFQMDLWRRSSLGRLAEVLGGNFIGRDVMTARVQYHGDMQAEWAGYPSRTPEIADAFVAGVNAWVFRARARLPDEFVLAGWVPDLWATDDLLNRTDAFLSSGDAELQGLRAQLVAAVGPRRADMLVPALAGRTPWPVADLDAAGQVVAGTVRRAGAAPFFAGFAAPFAGSNAWAIPAARSTTGAPLLANDPHRPMTSPALRYLVHLKAPGWNVIGATSPWLPGVVIGHNERVGWGMAAHRTSSEDVRVEPIDADVGHQTATVKDQRGVKNARPFAFDRQYTKHGVVIATDREHRQVFTLGWTGFEPGAAAELGALALDRAASLAEVREAVANWKMPVVDVVYADRTTVARQRSGTRTVMFDAVPLAANDNVARTHRLQELLGGAAKLGVDDVIREQYDVTSWEAGVMQRRLSALHAVDPRVEDARRQLVGWDRRVTPDSAAAALFVIWRRALWRRIAEARVPTPLVATYLALVPFDVADALKAPEADWQSALASAVDQFASDPDSGTNHPIFRHPLALTDASRRRFDVGPFRPGGYEGTVMAFSTRSRLDVGPSFREVLDLADWDRSVATNAPGQSEWTASPHFQDLARLWAAGTYFPLSFSDRAVLDNAESTLTLQPK